jgi:hypothetical protein
MWRDDMREVPTRAYPYAVVVRCDADATTTTLRFATVQAAADAACLLAKVPGYTPTHITEEK